MRKGKLIFKILSLFTVLLVPICFSDWTYLTKTSTVETLNDDEVTVTVLTRQQSNKIVTSSPVESDKVQDSSSSTPTLSEVIKMVPNPSYSEGEWLGDEAIFTGIESTLNDDKTIETIVSSYKREKIIKRESKYDWKKVTYTYTYTIAWFKWTSTVTKSRPAPVDSISDCKLKVRKNNTISPWDLPIDNYQQYSYFSDSGYTTLFDFKKPITASTDIYLKYFDDSSSLTQFINGKSSGTYSIYDTGRQGSEGDFDVASDFTYETFAGFDSLNKATIASGTTFNFTYLDNQLYPSPNTGGIADGDAADNTHRDSNANVALDYYNGQYVGNNNCSVMVRLNGDLTVKGTLNLGAKVGGRNSNSQFSEIIGQYAQIDLNGHNLIIDGGTVNCYGSIVDRTGGGEILIKNSGTLMGLLTVTDGRGGNQMTYGYGKGQSPFDEYRLAYIEAPIRAFYGTTIKAYLKLDLGGLGISNIYANIIGPSGSSVFSWGSKVSDADCFEIIPYINNNLYPSSISNPGNLKTIYMNMYYYRYKFNFKANVELNSRIPLNAEVNVKDLKKQSVTIDWARIGIPIPPFFDFRVYKGFAFTMKAKMILLPGSSFVTDYGSELIFDPGEVVKYDDVAIDVNLLVYKVEAYIKGETTRNRAGLMAYDRSFYFYRYDGLNNSYYGVAALADYWKYTKTSSHMLLGDITIRNMPDSYKYMVSGPISFSKQSLNKVLRSSYTQTYDIKGEQVGSLWFSSSASTYKSSFNLIISYNAVPLISNGKAYVKDESMNLNGIFDEETRFFIVGNKKYFFYTPNDYLIGGSDPSNQNALTDYTITPTLVDEEIGNQIIKSNGKYYLFYKGVFIPVLDSIASGTTYTSINANARKFCSNNSTDLNANSSKYDSAQFTYSSSNKRWAFSKFN